MTTFDTILINGTERKADALRFECSRSVNACGNWDLILRNTGGKFNGVFDVQNSLLVQVDSPPHPIMGGRLDGPGVTLRARDLESTWDEYALLKGVDGGQDLLFHNDFEQAYPDPTQQLKTVLNDIFNVQLAGLTNISYTPPVGATPVVGAIEFREGASFLTQLQELMKRAGYVFYVDDGLVLRCGAPGFSSTGLSFHSSPGASNIINLVDYQERDGDKHYNYIKLSGKNPMFDGWTELNAASWTSLPGTPALIDSTSSKVGAYSQVSTNNNPVNSNLSHSLTMPKFNYTTLNFNSGEIGFWAMYDNTAGAPGAPGAGTCLGAEKVECRLTDLAGNMVAYYGDTSGLFEDYWGYCTFVIGEDLSPVYSPDHWCILLGTYFDWSNITKMELTCPGGPFARYPSHFYVDGLSVPLPIISIAENAGAQASYRRRPYIDSWPHVRTQLALDGCANQLLTQSQSTALSKVSLVVPGDYRLRYAGQTVNIDIPSLGINTEVFYLTSLHQTVEPMVDISSGYGFDWTAEIEACPTSGVTYDSGRLRAGPMYSATQILSRGGVGLRIK